MDRELSKYVFNVINTVKTSLEDMDSYPENKLKEIEESLSLLINYSESNVMFNNLSKEDLELIGFRPFRLNSGLNIMLIPVYLFTSIKEGTELVSIYGDIVTIGIHKINKTPFGGHLFYGIAVT